MAPRDQNQPVAVLLNLVPERPVYIMRIVGFTILFLTTSCISGQEVERIFIPYSQLTGQALDNHIAEEVSRLMSDHGWSESEAKEYVKDSGGEVYRITEADIRSAFPSISATDKQASFCSNSIMGGASRLVFLSLQSDNIVKIKASSCHPATRGISCSPMSESINYYFESPEHSFTLEDGVSFTEADELLTIIRDDGITGLPDWYERQRFGYLDVTSIGKSNDVFVLTLGELFCRGCTTIFKLRILNPNSEKPGLTLVEEPEGMCI